MAYWPKYNLYQLQRENIERGYQNGALHIKMWINPDLDLNKSYKKTIESLDDVVSVSSFILQLQLINKAWFINEDKSFIYHMQNYQGERCGLFLKTFFNRNNWYLTVFGANHVMLNLSEKISILPNANEIEVWIWLNL